MAKNIKHRYSKFITKEVTPQAHLDEFDLQAINEGNARSKMNKEFGGVSSIKGKRFVSSGGARPATSRGNVLLSERKAKELEYGK